jgi:hypothetical protein
MQFTIKDVEDLRWLLGHTGGFRGGYVTDVQMAKRRLFDEGSGREVLADTLVTIVVRYHLRQMERVAKLTMKGVTDFSIFEQEGADCSSLGVIHAECTAGKLRFWFDPQGELYVVCDEAQLEEVTMPSSDDRLREPVARWTFQSQTAEWPTVEWLLEELDGAGLPCTWSRSSNGKVRCFRLKERTPSKRPPSMSCCMDRSMERDSESCCMWTAPTPQPPTASCPACLISSSDVFRVSAWSAIPSSPVENG